MGIKDDLKKAWQDGMQKGKQAGSPKYKREKQIEEKEKLKDLDEQGIPYCPKCHSTSITTTDKKLSLGRAIVGGAVAGEAGAVLGGLSSKKVMLLCMKCGHKWKPGK